VQPEYYFITCVMIVIYPIFSLIMTKFVVSLIVILHQNQELINSSKHILEIFPEAVIIRGFDQEKGYVSELFSNLAAKTQIIDEAIELNATFSVIKLKDDSDNFKHEDNNGYIQLLEQREGNHPNLNDDEEDDLQIKQTFNMDKSSETAQNESRFYSIKTIEVSWQECQKAYMHVFIDTTHIKKLEKERAVNKCQHIMFSSISHELRTPLNAFINAIDFLKYYFDICEKFIYKRE